MQNDGNTPYIRNIHSKHSPDLLFSSWPFECFQLKLDFVNVTCKIIVDCFDSSIFFNIRHYAASLPKYNNIPYTMIFHSAKNFLNFKRSRKWSIWDYVRAEGAILFKLGISRNDRVEYNFFTKDRNLLRNCSTRRSIRKSQGNARKIYGVYYWSQALRGCKVARWKVHIIYNVE